LAIELALRSCSSLQLILFVSVRLRILIDSLPYFWDHRYFFSTLGLVKLLLELIGIFEILYVEALEFITPTLLLVNSALQLLLALLLVLGQRADQCIIKCGRCQFWDL